MKTSLVIVSCMLCISLIYCNPARKAQVPPPPPPPMVTYAADVQPIITTKCTPCHIPPKGNKKPFDTYARASADIDSIISRIKRNPGDKGFMPFKHPKLPDSLIRVFEDWKAGGLVESSAIDIRKN